MILTMTMKVITIPAVAVFFLLLSPPSSLDDLLVPRSDVVFVVHAFTFFRQSRHHLARTSSTVPTTTTIGRSVDMTTVNNNIFFLTTKETAVVDWHLKSSLTTSSDNQAETDFDDDEGGGGRGQGQGNRSGSSNSRNTNDRVSNNQLTQQQKKKKHGLATQIDIVKSNNENSTDTVKNRSIINNNNNDDEEDDENIVMMSQINDNVETSSSCDDFVANYFNNNVDDDEEEDGASESKNSSEEVELFLLRETRRNKNPFTMHLSNLRENIKNPITRAYSMDDELKRLENRFYQLVGYEVADCKYPFDSQTSYGGPTIRPPTNAYEQVCQAYATAPRMGELAAVLAEDVVARYEKFHMREQDRRPSNKMMTFVMKCWLRVRDIDRAEVWLRKMEQNFETTQDIRDLPDPGKVYNTFLAGLTREGCKIHPKRAANLSFDCIRTMTKNRKLVNDAANVYPSRSCYTAAMKCQRDAYTGAVALRKIKTLFDYLKKDFNSSIQDGNTVAAMKRLKPTKHVAMHVVTAASNCVGKEAAEMNSLKIAEDVLHECHKLHMKTGDKDYRPHRIMYETIFSMYGKLPVRQKPSSFAKRVFTTLDMMKIDGVLKVNPMLIASALNKVMTSAEHQIPEDPLANPIWTRKMFNIVLDAFKRLHDCPCSSPSNANISSYEIFLRVCNRLPDGFTKTQLASRGFRLCRENGCVSQEAARQFQAASPEDARHVLNGLSHVTGTNKYIFPEEWTTVVQ